MIKKFNEFINETSWGGMVRRSDGSIIRKEDGYRIGVLDDGTVLYMDNESSQKGDIVEFDGKNYYYIKDTDDYIVVINNGDRDYYYRYEPNIERGVNVIESFDAGVGLRKDDFGFIKAFLRQSKYLFGDLDGIDITIGNHYVRFSYGSVEWEVWDDENAVQEYAIEREGDILDGRYDFKDSETMKKVIKKWRNLFGDEFIDSKSIEDSMRESYESLFDDMEPDDLIDDLIRYNLIEDSEKYFELDEDGNINHDLPKFECDDYKDRYVDYIMNQIDYVVDEYISNYGLEGFEKYIDFDELAKLIVNNDGRGSIISGYDGEEREENINGTIYYIYRIN